MKQVFIEASKGIYSATELCQIAYDFGLRGKRSGKKLAKSTMTNLLRNPFYHGAFLWKGKLYTKGVQHDPLISKELFDQVQKVLDKDGFRKKEVVEYLFPNTMICADCESTVACQSQKGIRYYHCSKWNAKKKGTQCSHKKYHTEDEIEEKITNLIQDIIVPDKFIDWGRRTLKDLYNEEVKELFEQDRSLLNSLKPR